MSYWQSLKEVDPEIALAISKEEERQRKKINLIASENYTSKAVLCAQGSVMTNKYAEGYPFARYYGGCEFVDEAESLAIQRAKELFGAEYVNVQPHSGSSANMAVYLAVLKPEDTILALKLSHGGHLTHGSKVSFSGQLFKTAFYGVDKETGRTDYQEVLRIARQVRPRLIVCGASAYPRIIDFEQFRKIADEVGAYLMADIAHIAGLVAAGLHPDPVSCCDFVTTTTHKTLRGPRGGLIMANEEFGKLLDKSVFPGIQGGPMMHTIAAKAVCFKEALLPSFKEDQHQTIKNAATLGKELAGYGFDLVSGGTDNHLLLINLRNKGITGKEAEEALGLAGIVANKNSIPDDEKPAQITSGLRLGTPAVTTRGMKEKEMIKIAQLINEVLADARNEGKIARARKEAEELCDRFPI
ncbi:serine hydroxymethyltransferase [bacterium]|nr:serine hydroxymethyltransferase [bacterium]MBU1614262.1 serine hydroxymethyltransferase [bacterium]